jgi:hypothetical protein
VQEIRAAAVTDLHDHVRFVVDPDHQLGTVRHW